MTLDILAFDHVLWVQIDHSFPCVRQSSVNPLHWNMLLPVSGFERLRASNSVIFFSRSNFFFIILALLFSFIAMCSSKGNAANCFRA